MFTKPSTECRSRDIFKQKHLHNFFKPISILFNFVSFLLQRFFDERFLIKSQNRLKHLAKICLPIFLFFSFIVNTPTNQTVLK